MSDLSHILHMQTLKYINKNLLYKNTDYTLVPKSL